MRTLIVIVLSLVLIVGAGAVVVLSGRLGSVTADCHVGGIFAGGQACTFTNTGNLPGKKCVRVRVHANDGPALTFSSPVCSGLVWGSSTVKVDVGGFEPPLDTVCPTFSECEMQVLDASAATSALAESQRAAAVQAIANPPPPPKPSWKRSTTTSEIDGSSRVVLGLEAPETIEGMFGKRVRPALMLTCEKKKTDAFVNAGVMLDSQIQTWSDGESYGSSTRSKVRWRFDDEKPTSGWWGISVDNEAVFIPHPIDFIKRLLQHQRLIVEVDVYQRGSQAVAFDLPPDLEGPLADLRRACKW